MNDTRVIKDPDARNALATLITEFENLEQTVEEKEEDIVQLEKEVEALKGQVEEYQARITELEEALAEAYLTDEISEV